MDILDLLKPRDKMFCSGEYRKKENSDDCLIGFFPRLRDVRAIKYAGDNAIMPHRPH